MISLHKHLTLTLDLGNIILISKVPIHLTDY